MRTTKHLTLLLVALLGLTVSTAGCLEDDRTFFIRQNQVPSAGCISNATTTIFNPRGTLDVFIGTGYWLYPLVENIMTSSEQVDGEPERNNLYLRGFEVELDLGDYPVSFPDDLVKFFTPQSGFIEPEGQLATSVQIIPDELVKKLNIPKGRKLLVMAKVKAVAQHGATTKRTGEFVYPVDLCNLCIVDWRDPCPKVDTSGTGTGTTVTVFANVCGLPQDMRVTCCQDAILGKVCYKSSSTSGG